MRVNRWLFSLLGERLRHGLFVKLRHAFPEPRPLLRAFGNKRAQDIAHRLDARILVVGGGAAAHAAVGQLRQEGFHNVTLVQKDQLFGGKCVNFGCMPSEFVLHRQASSVAELRQQAEAFVSALKAGVEQQFLASGYPLVQGTAVRVEGQILHLADGRQLPFDRLILAIGNDYSCPAMLEGLDDRVTLQEFWGLAEGRRLTIYAENNVSALSLAEVAAAIGLQPTVILSGNNPLAALPSFRHYLREIEGRGITVHQDVRLRRAQAGRLTFVAAGQVSEVEHDHLLSCGRPSPRFLEIDGKMPTIFDLDVVRSCLPARPDVIFLGDGSGLLTSSEAEVQAHHLIRAWKYGEHLDFRDLAALPVRLHGRASLAMAGPEWSYTVKDWQDVDFRNLGWSWISGQEGKLWYLLDKATGLVQAVHICHPQAGELISLAAALMPYPVWDVRWMVHAVHPSAAEILKLVALKAQAALGEERPHRLQRHAREVELKMSPADLFDPSGKVPGWISEAEWGRAVLSNSPWVSLAMQYGLSQMEALLGQPLSRHCLAMPDGRFSIEGELPVSLTVNAEMGKCFLSSDALLVIVDFSALSAS